MAHSSGYRIISQQYSRLSSISACVRAREKRRWTLRFCPFTKLFQTVCSVCLTIQTQFISRSSRGFRFHFNFLFYFFFFIYVQGILPGSAGERFTVQVFQEKKKKKGHCLWRRTKTFRIAESQPSLNTKFSGLAVSQ